MIRNLINALLAFTLALILFIAVHPKKVDTPKQLAKHVVPYRLLSKGNKRFATGFHMKYHGKVYIVTNRHVCDSNIRNYGHGNIQFGSYVGKIIAIDKAHDLCLVTSNRNDGLEMASRQSGKLEKVTVIGFPRGMGKVIREGRVISHYPIMAPWLASKNQVGPVKSIPIVDSIQISATAYGGNSGSPILNTNGRVTGVLFAGHRWYHTETYIVPLSYLKVFLALNAR